MKYITVNEAAEKWGLSRRSISHHLTAGRIPGAVKKGGFWLIPKDVAKPKDKRYKKSTGKTEESFGSPPSLTENKDLFVEMFKHFPYPVQICDPEGAMLFANAAFFRHIKLSDPPEDLRIFNTRYEPNLEKWGIKDFVERAYRGEVAHIYDVKMPIREAVSKYGGNAELPSESIFVNMTSFPIYDENHQIAYVVGIFIPSRYYQGREEVIQGKEYMDDHWKEDFDADALSSIVHISKPHYTRLFKQHTGTTPHQYYQGVKLQKLKEMLCDNNLSIAQVFDECGVNYNGNLAKKLKQELGMTPSEYRARMMQK
ncbi:transcriptional regulator, AraC family [Desulfofarcimen acetoxidans DSM 771]|jgi:AraC-like DNA-binding protein|uniref:Transcriptional regulator, AraC family n=1 Tax=Desulfofarcimen acetoxidans (strain ATCC 49208 / DSM 771 / KCTC 5769 / VKM B-1644 / 5575) TaxID=485916 RepID=C8W508_DESAS|nr:helix-turn-helix domain-containing protein [Desulfofarcimen acetoxidans]ACV61360.1 transcriptional regulator, AraC family [Desulfofarcimen acetoxidans DSM 771]